MTAGLFFPISVLPHENHEKGPHFRWEYASADPDRIFLSLTKRPAISQAVTWRTDTSVSKGYAQLALADPSSRFDLAAKTYMAKTSHLDMSASDWNLGYPSARYHSVIFQDLMPDTLYAYRVGGGEQHWSEWLQFRTAKPGPAPLRFLYFGDAQNGVLSHWSRIIRAAYAKAPDAAFTIHAGDLIDQAHKDGEWGEWFQAGGWIHATVPGIPVVGNHEVSALNEKLPGEKILSIQWPYQFTLPTELRLPEVLQETVYTIAYQGVRIVVLNSTEDYRIQADWLDQVLENNASPWTVVTFHHPIFSSGRERDNPEQRGIWKPVLERHKVDLVLQGHDHTYARGHIPVTMAASNNGLSTDITTLYVNSVSGAKMYPTNENRWDDYQEEGIRLQRMAENTQFFQVISVENQSLEYTCYMANGELYDRLILIKKRTGRNNWSTIRWLAPKSEVLKIVSPTSGKILKRVYPSPRKGTGKGSNLNSELYVF